MADIDVAGPVSEAFPHVFVTYADLRSIACDAWMVPTDRTMSVRPTWTSDDPELVQAIKSVNDSAFASGQRLATVPRWDHDSPTPVFTAVPYQGVRSGKNLPELQRAVDDFARLAGRAVREKVQRKTIEESEPSKSSQGREQRVPLIAMPILGAAGGGGAALKGDLIQHLHEAAISASEVHGVDIVLVVGSAEELALAQRIRRQQDPSVTWRQLSNRLRGVAEGLADEVVSGRLVPFLGAGVSMAAGAPSWKELLARLALDSGLTIEEQGELSKRDLLDQAEILLSLYGTEADFNSKVIEIVTTKHYSLAHSLIAALPIDEAITLNYDDLFERASLDVGRPCVVITGNSGTGSSSGTASRSLLKLHGSVADTRSIVLTRDDYLQFDSARNILAAMVKTALVTKKLLFIGFGLADDHFHQILFDVRSYASDLGIKNSVALTLIADPLDQRVWADKITLEPIASNGTDTALASRTLAIFLDYVLALSTGGSEYLLEPAFQSQLTESEQKIAEQLRRLLEVCAESGNRDPVSHGIIAALQRFGAWTP